MTVARRLGMATVPCLVIDADQEKAIAISLHENLFRVDLNTVDEAVMYAYLRDTLDYTQTKIAEMVRKGDAYVSQRLSIILWPKDLRDALHEDHISFSVARELSMIKDPKQISYFLRHAIQGGANYRTVRQWRLNHEANLAPVATSAQMDSSPDKTTPQVSETVHCYWCGQECLNEDVLWIPLCRSDYDQMTASRDTPDKE